MWHLFREKHHVHLTAGQFYSIFVALSMCHQFNWYRCGRVSGSSAYIHDQSELKIYGTMIFIHKAYISIQGIINLCNCWVVCGLYVLERVVEDSRPKSWKDSRNFSKCLSNQPIFSVEIHLSTFCISFCISVLLVEKKDAWQS
jgi:hypothetical protein